MSLVEKLKGEDAGRLYALKRVSKVSSQRSQQKIAVSVMRERRVLEMLSSCHFLPNLCYAFQTSSDYYLVIDYASKGDLFELIEREGPLKLDLAKFYMAELLLAVQYLHEHGIIHRDIKPDNILIAQDGHLLLSDFGLSKIFSADTKNHFTSTFVGTRVYMAPEVLKGKNEAYSYGCDIWGCGVVLYEILTGELPFDVHSEDSRLEVYKKVTKRKNLDFPLGMTRITKSILFGMLQRKPTRRLGCGVTGIEEIKKNVFFTGIIWEELENKLTRPPYIPEDKDQEENRLRASSKFKDFSYSSPKLNMS